MNGTIDGAAARAAGVVAGALDAVVAPSSSWPACRRRRRRTHQARNSTRARHADDGADADDDRARQLAALLLLGLLLVLQLAVGLLPFTLLGSHERRRLTAASGCGSAPSQARVVVDADVARRLEQPDEADRAGVGIDGEPQAAEVGEVLVDGAGVAADGPQHAGVGRRRSGRRPTGVRRAMSSRAGSTRAEDVGLGLEALGPAAVGEQARPARPRSRPT